MTVNNKGREKSAYLEKQALKASTQSAAAPTAEEQEEAAARAMEARRCADFDDVSSTRVERRSSTRVEESAEVGIVRNLGPQAKRAARNGVPLADINRGKLGSSDAEMAEAEREAEKNEKLQAKKRAVPLRAGAALGARRGVAAPRRASRQTPLVDALRTLPPRRRKRSARPRWPRSAPRRRRRPRPRPPSRTRRSSRARSSTTSGRSSARRRRPVNFRAAAHGRSARPPTTSSRCVASKK